MHCAWKTHTYIISITLWTRNSHTLLLTDLSGLPTSRQFVFAGQQKETHSSLKAYSCPQSSWEQSYLRHVLILRLSHDNKPCRKTWQWLWSADWYLSLALTVQISRIFRWGLAQLRLLTLSGLQTTHHMYWTTGRQLSYRSQALNVLLVRFCKWQKAAWASTHSTSQWKFTVCEWMESWEGLLHWLQGVEVWVKAGGAEKFHSLVPRPSYCPVLIANPWPAISCLLFVMKNWMMGNPLWNKLQQEVPIIPYTQHFSIKYV